MGETGLPLLGEELNNTEGLLEERCTGLLVTCLYPVVVVVWLKELSGEGHDIMLSLPSRLDLNKSSFSGM